MTDAPIAAAPKRLIKTGPYAGELGYHLALVVPASLVRRLDAIRHHQSRASWMLTVLERALEESAT